MSTVQKWTISPEKLEQMKGLYENTERRNLLGSCAIYPW
jgi:hypothetical protein